jgi:hypothetical protein
MTDEKWTSQGVLPCDSIICYWFRRARGGVPEEAISWSCYYGMGYCTGRYHDQYCRCL